jgi:hypothetical protein
MFSYVPHVPQILNVFLKGVPNNTSHYPISFAQSSPLLTYIGEPKGRYFSSQRKCYFGESPKFPVFFCVMGQTKWPITEKNTEIGRQPI